MPEPRVNLQCGDFTIAHRHGGIIVRPVADLYIETDLRKSAYKWKFETLNFEFGSKRGRPSQVAWRADKHPQNAATWSTDSACVELGGGAQACVAESWAETRKWLIEYPADTEDVSKFWLKTNECTARRYLTIMQGELKLVPYWPRWQPWQVSFAGSAFTSKEAAKMCSIVPTVAAGVYFASVHWPSAVLALQGCEHVVGEIGGAQGGYIDAGRFSIDKTGGAWSFLRPKLFRYA